ncbi:MAG: hypothetical protein AAF098_04650 [Pseudomonadota bacterium]
MGASLEVEGLPSTDLEAQAAIDVSDNTEAKPLVELFGAASDGGLRA